MMNSLSELYFHLIDLWPYSEQALFTASVLTVIVTMYWGSNLALYLVDHYNLFPQYKIIPNQWPEKELVKRCLRDMVIRHFIRNPLELYFFTYPVAVYLGLQIRAPLPSLGTILWQIFFFMVVTDFTFYWSHRLLHHRLIYKHIHKQHQFKVTSGIAIEYAHPIEQILSNGIPTILGPLLVGAHLSVWWLWLVLRLWETIDAHSGYRFPWSPWDMFPAIQGGADRHDFHHSHNVGNYGAFFTFWDWIMGTDRAYTAWVEKKKEKKKEEKKEEKEKNGLVQESYDKEKKME